MSIFKSSLKAFFVSLSSVIGIALGLFIAILAIVLIAISSDDKTFSSCVKIMPDAHWERKELSSDTPVLLQLNIKGEIGKDDLKADKVENILLRSREEEFKDNRVKGVLLVINSPGGDVIDSDIIYSLIKEYKELYKTPVFAFADGLCASGGYYIACAADKIVASDVSLIGSVGVLSWPPFFNVTDLMRKIGVHALTLFAGKDKDAMNPTRPWKADESKTYQEMLDYYYERFVTIVTKARPEVKKESLQQEYGAHLFPAPTAKEKGYVDGTGYSTSRALKELALAAGIKEEEKYQVVTIKGKEWIKNLFDLQMFSGKVVHEIKLPAELSAEGNAMPVRYLYRTQ